MDHPLPVNVMLALIRLRKEKYVNRVNSIERRKKMKEIRVKPLKGEERRKRAILDEVSEVAFLVDFVKLRMGRKGIVELGEHLGSIEKLGWKDVMHELSPGEFLARTYRGNYEPVGFKARIYEERQGASAFMSLIECPYVSFLKRYMKGIGSLTEEDLCSFCQATFEWVSEFNFKPEWQRVQGKCRLILSKG
jgi:hypothetical protein